MQEKEGEVESGVGDKEWRQNEAGDIESQEEGAIVEEGELELENKEELGQEGTVNKQCLTDAIKEVEKVNNDASKMIQFNKDVVNDVEDEEMVLVKKGGKIDQSKMYYIVAPWTMPTCIWTDKSDKVKWIGQPGKKLVDVVESLTKLLQEELPSNILVLSLQEFIGDTSFGTIERVLDEITRMAMGSIHKLAWCCVFYVPQLERLWSKVTEVNQQIRLCNLNMDQAPCNLHKKMLISVNKGRVFYIRPNLFTEFVNKTGVGETLNMAGLVRVKEVVDLYCENAFGDEPRLPSKAVPGDVEPPPLFLSRGYKDDPNMQEFIRKSGLRMPSRQFLQARKQAVQPRNKSLPKKLESSGTRNQEARGQPRVKIPDNGLRWTEEDDMTVEELEAKRQLEGRKKSEKKRLGPDMDDLQGRLRQLRLRGVEEGKKARSKEKYLEGKIKSLEREINEMTRKLREQKERLREHRESDRKIRDLKQEVQDKDSKVRRLRGDLEEMKEEMEAWRSAYEKICEVVDGKRRRK